MPPRLSFFPRGSRPAERVGEEEEKFGEREKEK
jgi:hypothetical protein